jgi:hypothetical protein
MSRFKYVRARQKGVTITGESFKKGDLVIVVATHYILPSKMQELLNTQPTDWFTSEQKLVIQEKAKKTKERNSKIRCIFNAIAKDLESLGYEKEDHVEIFNDGKRLIGYLNKCSQDRINVCIYSDKIIVRSVSYGPVRRVGLQESEFSLADPDVFKKIISLVASKLQVGTFLKLKEK